MNLHVLIWMAGMFPTSNWRTLLLAGVFWGTISPCFGQSAKTNFDWKIFGEKMKAAVKSGKLSERQASETNRLMKFYVALDANGNQVIEPAEYEKSRYRSTIEKRIREAGMDPSRPVALDAFVIKRLENAGIKSPEIRRVFSVFKPQSQVRITLDLPEQYLKWDADRDNQLGLYEWPKDQLPKFFEFDLNDDGFATPREIHIVESAPQPTDDSK